MINIDKISEELKALKIWATHSNKTPYRGYVTQNNIINKAKSNDQSTWTSFDNAIKLINNTYKETLYNKDTKKYDIIQDVPIHGLSMALTEPYIFIDLDHVINNKGETLPEALDIGAIGVIYAYESYNPNSNTAFDTWVYSCIKWQVLRTLRLDVKNSNVKEISIYSDVADGEDIKIIDMLEDTSVNVYNAVENICMKEFINEFKRLLDGKELEYSLFMYTNNISSYKEASNILEVDNTHLRSIVFSAYQKLKRSAYLYNRYKEICRQRDLIKANRWNTHILDCVIARERLKLIKT